MKIKLKDWVSVRDKLPPKQVTVNITDGKIICPGKIVAIDIDENDRYNEIPIWRIEGDINEAEITHWKTI